MGEQGWPHEPTQYAGLTPVEQVLAEADLHMRECDEPQMADCETCTSRLAKYRAYLAVLTVAGHLSPPGWKSVAALQEAHDQLAEERAYRKDKYERLHGSRLLSVVFGHHPGAPRPFALYRNPPRTLVALGAEFPGGAIALRLANDGGWTTRSDGGAEAFAAGDGLEVVWLSDELDSLAAVEAERDEARAAAKEALDEAIKLGEAQLRVIDQRDEARSHLSRALTVVEAARAWRGQTRLLPSSRGDVWDALSAAVDAYEAGVDHD